MRKINRNGKVLIIATSTLLAGFGIFWYLRSIDYFSHTPAVQQRNQKDSGYIDTSPASADQTTAGWQAKEESADNSNASTPSLSSNPITGRISSMNQSNGTLYVRTIIDIVSSEGSCTLTMTGPKGKQYTSTVGTQAMSSYSVCGGYNIPIDQLATGNWDVVIVYKTATTNLSLSGAVEVQ